MPDFRRTKQGRQASLLQRLGRHASRSLRRWQITRTVAALESLSDEVLDNIGISRADIPAIAFKVTSYERSPELESRSSAQPSGKEVRT